MRPISIEYTGFQEGLLPDESRRVESIGTLKRRQDGGTEEWFRTQLAKAATEDRLSDLPAITRGK
jgi:hypothetical protein